MPTKKNKPIIISQKLFLQLFFYKLLQIKSIYYKDMVKPSEIEIIQFKN